MISGWTRAADVDDHSVRLPNLHLVTGNLSVCDRRGLRSSPLPVLLRCEAGMIGVVAPIGEEDYRFFLCLQKALNKVEDPNPTYPIYPFAQSSPDFHRVSKLLSLPHPSPLICSSCRWSKG